MIESSLLKTRIRLLQCYDWKPTALCVSQNGSFQSPCSLWEQEFRSSTDIRQPSTVNRVLVSCSGVIGNSPLLVCHTERRPQSPCSMWEQELNRYPSIVNRQPSTVFKRQPGCADPQPVLYEPTINETLRQCWFKGRRRRWPNTKPTLDQYLVVAELLSII